MQKVKARWAEARRQIVLDRCMAHVGSNAGATGVHRSVELNMQLVIARLFREPHLQFTWIGDGLLCGHKFASQFSAVRTTDVKMHARRLE